MMRRMATRSISHKNGLSATLDDLNEALETLGKTGVKETDVITIHENWVLGQRVFVIFYWVG